MTMYLLIIYCPDRESVSSQVENSTAPSASSLLQANIYNAVADFLSFFALKAKHSQYLVSHHDFSMTQ